MEKTEIKKDTNPIVKYWSVIENSVSTASIEESFSTF